MFANKLCYMFFFFCSDRRNSAHFVINIFLIALRGHDRERCKSIKEGSKITFNYSIPSLLNVDKFSGYLSHHVKINLNQFRTVYKWSHKVANISQPANTQIILQTSCVTINAVKFIIMNYWTANERNEFTDRIHYLFVFSIP